MIPISEIKPAVDKVTVVLQRDMVKENESSWLLDFSQVKGPLNKLRPMFTFSLPLLILKNRLFIHIIRVAEKGQRELYRK